MAVNLSPYGGVGAQFLDNSGNVLTGGKIYTYAAGTTTPQATYTSSLGNVALANPIILDASGRVPTGEIWLTDGLLYKFVLKDSNDVLIATYDNVIGINSNFVNFTNEQEIQVATAGQTVFNLTTLQYQPGTNSLSVFVDGVNQYGPGAQYAYLETDSDTVTFVNGLHVGAEVKFTTSQLNSSASSADAFQVNYTPPFTGSVSTNVGDKLAQTVSVMDFGAVGDGVTDDTAAVADAAQNSYAVVPAGTYEVAFDASSGYVTKGLIGVDPTVELNNPNLDEATVAVGTTNYQRPNRAKVENLGITGANTDLTNNYPDLSTWSSFSHYIGNYIYDISSGLNVSYNGENNAGATAAFGGTIAQFVANVPVAQPLRASTGATVAFNNIVNANIIGQQIFCANHSRVIGNSVVNNSASTQHGYRFTGYPGGPTYFNSAVANTSKNVQNGLSIQSATRYNSFNGFVTEAPTIAGVFLNTNSTLANWHHSYNYLQGISKGGTHGVYAAKPQYNHIQHIVDGATTWGVQFDASGTYGLNKGNMLDAVIANSGEGASINSSNNHVRVVLSQIGGRGITVAGSYNIIDVVCDTPSTSVNTFALQISGSNNMVRITSVGNANTADISISGNQNLIECMCAKSITVSGDDNKFIGLINTVGTTNISNSGTGNDFNGLKGVSGIYVGTATTNASGQVTISSTYDRPQGGGGLTYYAIGQLQAAAGTLAGCTVNYVNSTTTNGFNFVVYDAVGAPLASTSVTIVVQFGHNLI